MFRNEYQGGAFIELFNSTYNKNPVNIYVSSGVNITSDDETRCKILILEGKPTTTRLQLPKDTKQGLGLAHPFLVLQIFIYDESDFSFELCLCDSESTRRKVIFSTFNSEIVTTSQLAVAKVPLNIVKRNEWLNLCVDLSSFVAQLWRGKTYRSLDSIIVTASCKLTKIFTLKDEPADTSNNSDLYNLPKSNRSTLPSCSSIPRKLQLPTGVSCSTQVINMSKLCLIEWTRPPAAVHNSDASVSSHYSMRVGSGGSSRENSSRENSSRGRLSNKTESSASSSTESVRYPGPLCPRPPSEPSSGDSRHRRVRVKSQQFVLPNSSDATVVRETRSAGMASELASDNTVTPPYASKSQSAGKNGPRALKNERRIGKLVKSGSTEAAKALGSFDSDSSDLYYFRSPPRATSRESNRSESIPAIHSRRTMHKSASVHCIQRGVSSNVMSPPVPRKDEKDCEPVVKTRDKSNSRKKRDEECSCSHSISVNRKSLREISGEELNKKSRGSFVPPQPSAMTPSPRQPTIRGGPSQQKRKTAKAPLTMMSVSTTNEPSSNTSNKNVQTSPQPCESDAALNLQEYALSDNISDSFEARMLASLAQSDDGIIISDKSPRRSVPPTTTNQIAGSYCDDEEDTMTNTLTGPNPPPIIPVRCSGKNGPNPCIACLKGEPCLAEPRDGYLEEMRGAWPSTMRSSQEEVSISLPLDHSICPQYEATNQKFSPSIILDNSGRLHNLSPNTSAAISPNNDLSGPNSADEQLQLLYDPILNCYYDPVTYKYYELV